jgi:hypothetical protein
VTLVLLVLLAVPGRAQWTDGFESYPDGSPLEGQGDWHGWDGNDTLFSVVTSNLAHSGQQCVSVGPGADTVHEYAGHTFGKWLLRTYVYVPSWYVGRTYFMVLNAYQDGGPYQYSVQLSFDGDNDEVDCPCGSTMTMSVPLVRDQWVELRCEIDIAGDYVEFYYNGALLAGWAWSTGSNGLSSFTELGIEAIDLWPSLNSDPHTRELFFDDFELSFFSGPVGMPYCFGDGSGSPCPCGNQGGPGEGCASSSGAGAVLSAVGSASVSVDDMVCEAAGAIPSQPALLFGADNALNNGNGVPFGDGLRCAGGNVIRFGVMLPDAAGGASWGPGLGATGGWGVGDVRRFQVWYRDPSGGPCGSGFNLSNGLEVTFVP